MGSWRIYFSKRPLNFEYTNFAILMKFGSYYCQKSMNGEFFKSKYNGAATCLRPALYEGRIDPSFVAVERWDGRSPGVPGANQCLTRRGR